jgi:hypothetical protein
MIEISHDRLRFSFPGVHAEASLALEFQRTLRIPDDGRDYPLPAGLGRFPIRHVDDFASNAPARWLEHGGVMLPMYQAEAMWINFSGGYPFAVKVCTGKISAVTGEAWRDGLNLGPQDYLVATKQPWLDGYCVEKGFIRQFVAMPLGRGYSVEEQITGEAEHGGLQIVAYPMKADVYEERVARLRERARSVVLGSGPSAYSRRRLCASTTPACDMGLAPGGRMRQEIYRDRFGLEAWDLRHSSRCFVHIANSATWRAITGSRPPTHPITAKDYGKAHLPWFDYYAEGEALDAPNVFSRLKSVVGMGRQKGETPIPHDPSVQVHDVVKLREGLRPGQVREGTF